MKCVIITDTHAGVRQDRPIFYEYEKKFYDNILFPFLEKHKIDVLFHLGDLVDNRKAMNYSSLTHLQENFLDPLKSMKIDTVWNVGNHDSHYKNSLKTNAVRKFVDFGMVVDQPDVYYGKDILVVPWICRDNRDEIMTSILKSQARFCFGHFELKGFERSDKSIINYGDDKHFLNNFELVLSGHYHHRCSSGNVTYIGNPFEHTWDDYGDVRGFAAFNDETGKISYIKNPYRMFSKLEYRDDLIPDISSVKDTFCRVVINEIPNEIKLKDFMKRIEDQGIISLTLVDNSTKTIIGSDSENNSTDMKQLIVDIVKNSQLTYPEEVLEKMIEVYHESIKEM